MSGNNQVFSKTAIQNVMDIFVNPEVKRRQEQGELPKPLRFRCAQVILFPDDRKPLVRINEDVRAKAKVKYKPGISKKKDDPVYEGEIESIEHVELGPDDDPDCGHIFLYDLSEDPEEQNNLMNEHSQEAKKLMRFINKLPDFSHGKKPKNIPENIKELLKSLGYIH